MDLDKCLKINLELPFASVRIAEIVYDVLRVDAEPKRSGVTKLLSLEDTVVKVSFAACLARQLRVAINNFFEKVDLIVETIQAMGPPMPEHTPAPTPSRAVYGFVMFLSFNIAFILYLIWALLPEAYFEQFGIDFLPQRYWAVSVPIYILTVLTIFAFLIYPSLGLLMTPDMDDVRTVTDEVGKRRKKNGERLNFNSKKGNCVCKDMGQCWKEYYDLGAEVEIKKRIPVVSDLEIWDVSEHLYL